MEESEDRVATRGAAQRSTRRTLRRTNRRLSSEDEFGDEEDDSEMAIDEDNSDFSGIKTRRQNNKGAKNSRKAS